MGTHFNGYPFLQFYDCVALKSGPFNYGLSNSGEAIRLYNAYGTLEHSIVYDDNTPWPTQADGDGNTLEISDITGDVNNGLNYTANCLNGTPGQMPNIQCEYCTDLGDNEKEQVEIVVFPNPAHKELFVIIRSSDLYNADLMLYDIQGRRITSKQINDLTYNNQVSFNTSDLISGVYLLEIKLNQSTIVTKKVHIINN